MKFFSVFCLLFIIIGLFSAGCTNTKTECKGEVIINKTILLPPDACSLSVINDTGDFVVVLKAPDYEFKPCNMAYGAEELTTWQYPEPHQGVVAFLLPNVSHWQQHIKLSKPGGAKVCNNMNVPVNVLVYAKKYDGCTNEEFKRLGIWF
jgi:hypothetical protein